MNKYQLSNGVGLGIFGLLALSACQPSKKVQTAQKPNIIYILVDDMGYGDLGCYGQQTLTTPNIDKLAAEGMRFTNHYTGSSVCGPSRAALMTGKHTGHASVRGNAPNQLLSDTEMTLAKLVKSQGYKTGIIGKWGIGHPPPADDPMKKGFDFHYGYINMWHAHNLYPEFLYRNGVKEVLEGNKLQLVNGENPWKNYPEGTGIADSLHRAQYTPFLFDNEALKFIDQNKKEPFFLMMCYNTPHANNEATPNGLEVPDFGEYANKDWPKVEKGFATMVRNLDNSVAKIMAKLKEDGLDENTIVMFASDNGPHQEGGHIMEFFNSNGDLHGKKRDFWDGGVKTPFIVRWPGKVPAGKVSNQRSVFWDVLPTFADIVGAKTPETDGISFYPTLMGDTANQKQSAYYYWEFYENGGVQAVLKDNYKFIKSNVRDHKNPITIELYDLATDPAEAVNIATQHPDIIAEMEEILKKSHTDFAATSLFNEDGKKVDTPF